MKKLISLLFIVLVGYLVYTMLNQTPSEELQQIKAMRKEVDLAINQYMRALRFSSGFGMDTVGDRDMAIARVKKVQKEFRYLQSQLQEEKALEKAAILEKRIENFLEKNDL